MGTGASAKYLSNASSQLEAASDAELQDTLHGLSASSRGKIRTVLKELEVPAEQGTSQHDVVEEAEYYFYKSVRYESMDELVKAMAGAEEASPSHVEEMAEPSVRELFHRYSSKSGEALEIHDFKGLAASLAAELGMNPRRFGDFSIIFHRFDVNSDGKLDEEECVMLAESMLRHYFHDLNPGTPGGVKLLNLELKDLEAHYDLAEKMGEGGQGAVYLAHERSTKHERVVKFYDKRNTNAPLEEIKDEFVLLKSLDHPRIQRVYDIFEDRSNVYVVAEPYRGGDLRELIDNAMEAGVSVTSSWLAHVVLQVLQGVAYLHSKYIIHCDLKESNVMVTTAENWREPSVVVIDFGLARNFAVDGSNGGTAGYIPPEVWTTGLWTPKGDVFALGVIMFQLFSNGVTCFKGRDNKALMTSTCETSPDLGAITRFFRRCDDLIPLLEGMLSKDFHKRPTVRDCMEHRFFVKRTTKNEDEDYLHYEVVDALDALKEQSELQSAIAADIAARLNLAEMTSLNEAFAAMDADHDGVLTAEEVQKSLIEVFQPEDVERIVQRLVGPAHQVAYTTFMGRLLASQVADSNRLLWREFKQLDSAGSGYLARRDVAKLLERPTISETLGGRGVPELMTLMDADGDGRVSFEEFKRTLGGEAKIGEGVLSSSGFHLDQQVEYDSPSWKEWVPCKVVAVSSNGSIKVDLRPDYWMRKTEQARRLRAAH